MLKYDRNQIAPGGKINASPLTNELRFHFGPGYRVYYTHSGRVLIYVLGAGDKSSQRKDIAKAKALARTIEE